MHVEVEFASMSPSRADHFAEVMRQLPVVSLVRLRLAGLEQSSSVGNLLIRRE
jgi:hypothetical protein